MKKIFIETEKKNIKIKLYKNNCFHTYVKEQLLYTHKKTNIYLGKIKNIKKNIEAAFINYGALKYGFLPLNELIYTKVYCKKFITKKSNFQIIQILKEEKNIKGAFLTCNINLIGYFIIIYPLNNKKSKICISKKIPEKKKNQLKHIIKTINFPKNMNIILRTTTKDVACSDIILDLNILLEQWECILKKVKKVQIPSLIYQGHNKIIHILQDFLKYDISNIIIDNKKILNLIKHYTFYIKNKFLKKIIFLKKHKKNILSQFNNKMSNTKKIILPSGGTLIFSITEALITIDINSAKYKKGIDNNKTAIKINKEAVDTIAKYIRLENLGGIIIIDFIDMVKTNNIIIEKRLINALKNDEAKITIGKISKFGILELIRQNTKSININYYNEYELRKNFLYLIYKKINKLNITTIFKITFNQYLLIIKYILQLKNIEKKNFYQFILYPKI